MAGRLRSADFTKCRRVQYSVVQETHTWVSHINVIILIKVVLNVSSITSHSTVTLPMLKDKYQKNYEQMAVTLREDFDENQIESIHKVSDYLYLSPYGTFAIEYFFLNTGALRNANHKCGDYIARRT